MNTSPKILVRWLVLIPVALLAVGITQIATMYIVQGILYPIFGSDASWIRSVAKTISTSLMGATFISIIWWLTPSHKKIIASVSLLISIVWASTFIFHGFAGQVTVWLVTMGFSGLIGVFAAYFIGYKYFLNNHLILEH